jgi:hypothetical protein
MLTVSLTAYSSPAPRTDYRPSFLSQARVDRFTFLGQKAKDALVQPEQGFPADELLQRFDAQDERPWTRISERPFVPRWSSGSRRWPPGSSSTGVRRPRLVAPP